MTKQELMEEIDRMREEEEENKIYLVMKILYHELDEGGAQQDSDN